MKSSTEVMVLLMKRIAIGILCPQTQEGVDIIVRWRPNKKVQGFSDIDLFLSKKTRCSGIYYPEQHGFTCLFFSCVLFDNPEV